MTILKLTLTTAAVAALLAAHACHLQNYLA